MCIIILDSKRSKKHINNLWFFQSENNFSTKNVIPIKERQKICLLNFGSSWYIEKIVVSLIIIMNIKRTFLYYIGFLSFSILFLLF